MIQKKILILGHPKMINGDLDYLGRMGEEFEPETTSLINALCDADSTSVDIGANIGLTTLTLSEICHSGKVIAIEPVLRTFELLNKNLKQADTKNVSTFNVAVGASEGSVSMYVNERNLATSFVVDIDSESSQEIPMIALDTLVSRLELEQLNFIKIDVEGCELEVLKGAKNTLSRLKPIVMLEMNHWCLNVFRRISLPEFKETLLQIFPYVYAVDQGEYLDFSDPLNAGSIFHAHVFENRYLNIVAGFNQAELVNRLSRLKPGKLTDTNRCTVGNTITVQKYLNAIQNYRSWKIMKSIRNFTAWVSKLRL